MNPNVIRSALENGDMFLEYLPTIRLADRRCVGAEALIRMRSNERIISPLEFMPVIEPTSLGGIVTYWVIETVGSELRNWLKTTEEVHIGINVPPQLLGRGGIEYSIRKAGLFDVTSKLMLEISERGLIDELGVSSLSLAEKTNMLVAIDDVTLKEANIVAMSRASIDCIKLDKSVVDEIASKSGNPDTRTTVSLLAHLPRLRIIAEGVETLEQAKILETLGVKLAQGFLFSKPLRAQEFLEYWKRHS